MTHTRRFTAWSLGLLALGLSIVAVWGLPPQFAAARSHDLQSQVKDLMERVRALEAKLTCMTRDGDEVIFEQCNVHIRNGGGKTDSAVNGLGNLILGYNEGSGANIKRTGSHNLIIGPEHAYTSFGGLVVGREHTISAPYASISGGRLNTASGFAASVSGGSVNTASADFASVSGGKSNEARGLNASVSGGISNLAQGEYASVSGGSDNAAGGFAASISGGSGNAASGNYSSISGGRRHSAIEQDAWRAGNLSEKH